MQTVRHLSGGTFVKTREFGSLHLVAVIRSLTDQFVYPPHRKVVEVFIETIKKFYYFKDSYNNMPFSQVVLDVSDRLKNLPCSDNRDRMRDILAEEITLLINGLIFLSRSVVGSARQSLCDQVDSKKDISSEDKLVLKQAMSQFDVSIGRDKFIEFYEKDCSFNRNFVEKMCWPDLSDLQDENMLKKLGNKMYFVLRGHSCKRFAKFFYKSSLGISVLTILSLFVWFQLENVIFNKNLFGNFPGPFHWAFSKFPKEEFAKMFKLFDRSGHLDHILKFVRELIHKNKDKIEKIFDESLDPGSAQEVRKDMKDLLHNLSGVFRGDKILFLHKGEEGWFDFYARIVTSPEKVLRDNARRVREDDPEDSSEYEE
ncbi:hypothetical protein ACFLY6_03255 [Candidatus Dependentiae bacterium]